MIDLLTIIVPIFGLIAVGWGAARFGLLGQRASEGLSDYVFALAVPALIIRSLTEGVLPPVQPWGYWAAYFGGVAVTWALAAMLFRRFLGRDATEAALFGFAASQSNTVLVGVPLILRAYGEEGAVPLFLLLAVHLPLMLGVVTLLIERTLTEATGVELLRRLGVTLITHPILLAVMLGGALKLMGLAPTGVVKSLVDQLAMSASPCSLVVMGLALHRHGIVGGIGAASILSGLKLMLHPFLVWALAFHVLDVPPVWAGVAVLFAAMPVGVNSVIVAGRYRIGEDVVSSALAVSTIAAVPTATFWLIVLGIG